MRKPSKRSQRSFKRRLQATKEQTVERPSYVVPSKLTPDETDNDCLFTYSGSFHKLFRHDPTTGLLTQGGKEDYEMLLKGLGVGKFNSNYEGGHFANLELNKFDQIPCVVDGQEVKCEERGNNNDFRDRVLINPRASKAFSIKGADITSIRVSKLIYGYTNEKELQRELYLGSAESAAEMIEVYAMALLRNKNLGEYDQSDSDFVLIANALNSLADSFKWGVTSDDDQAQSKPCKLKRVTASNFPVSEFNLFRGVTDGDLKGDYLSIFLTMDRPPLFPSGCAPFVADRIGAGNYAKELGEPLQIPIGKDRDFVRTWCEYICLQNGGIPEKYPSQDFFVRGNFKKNKRGRDLGNYVHVDNVYEEYIRAADILVGQQYMRSTVSPYGGDPEYVNEGDGPTLGPADAWALIGGVRETAESAAFTQKWLVARRARPEVMAALIDRELRDDMKKCITKHYSHPDVNRFLERIADWNQERSGERNYLLPQIYPEGSPAHPSWPSGHATVAGACVTVLKAIFNDEQPIKDSGESTPEKWVALTSKNETLTVGGELDKLASNISFGRNFAGVHYRSDGEHGILLGEEIAIRYLQDHLRTYREELIPCDKTKDKWQDPNFVLTKRNGCRICITPDIVVPLGKADKASFAEGTMRIYNKENL